MLSTNQFAYRKGLGTCDAILCVAHTLQSALETGQEASIVQIDFSAAFDRVNQVQCAVGGSVLSVPSQVLANRPKHVVVNGCRSNPVNVLSGVPQGSVLGPLSFLLFNAELFFILEIKRLC